MSLRCPVCGTDSLVPALSQGPPGNRVLRQVCRECERRQRGERRERARQVGVVVAHLAIVGGVVLGAITLSADYLGISGKRGFGWRQLLGAETGFLCVVLGLLLRRTLLGVGGLFLLVLSLAADLLRVGHSPGLGWRKQIALLVAIVLVAVGGVAEAALRRRKAVAEADQKPAESDG